MKRKGFTLIELLVVIAIIGILAAMVLVALSTARNKAKDARIKSDIGQIRTQAEVYYDDHTNSYTGFCADASIDTLETDIADNTGAITCNEAGDGTSAAFSSTLNGGGNWCQDTRGINGTNAAAAGVCP